MGSVVLNEWTRNILNQKLLNVKLYMYIYICIYIYIYIYKFFFMEDVQRNSHAQTRNNATDKINGEENEFQKREIWK